MNEFLDKLRIFVQRLANSPSLKNSQLRNTRRIQLWLSSSDPYQRRFGQVVQALGSG